MTKPVRTLDDILAEADADAGDQERPVIEPLSLKLLAGRVITFREPDDVSVEEMEGQRSVSDVLRNLCQSKADFNALWKEVGPLPIYRANNLADWIGNYYEEQRKKLRSSTPSDATGTK